MVLREVDTAQGDAQYTNVSFLINTVIYRREKKWKVLSNL